MPGYPKLRCRYGLKARILLEDGYRVEACGFGAEGIRVGEVVFSTSMTGYTESLTDPSYRGQILVYTHPMVGNYGVPSRSFTTHGVPASYESNSIQVEAFIVAELPWRESHYLSVMSLHEWLRSEGVPGVYRVDTRALVKRLRERGVMMGVVAVYRVGEEAPHWDELEELLEKAPRYDELIFIDKVSPREPVVHEPEGDAIATVAILDCGVKLGIVRQLLQRRLRVIRYPYNTDASKLAEADAIVLSNGPGNPAVLVEQQRIAREAAEYGKPLLAICLGTQLLSLGFGAKTFKLPYGHRGPNKPVVDVEEDRCYITTQNHGYAVDESSLEGTGLKLWFRNPDDGTVEGVKHVKLPVMAVQFHPEGGPGPWDTSWLFDRLARMAAREAEKHA